MMVHIPGEHERTSELLFCSFAELGIAVSMLAHGLYLTTLFYHSRKVF